MAKNYAHNFGGEDETLHPIEEDSGDHTKFYSFVDDFGGMRKSLSMSDLRSLRKDLNKLEFADTQEEVLTGQPQELSRTKFVSMAEAIYDYQRDTPDIFHSSRPRSFRAKGNRGPLYPVFRCKARSRTQHVLSQKEKEELELEEIRKFKIKANPIPKSVIEGPKHLPEVPRKPVTVPVPFNLTEIQKKAALSPRQVPNFKASPAPKHILEKPQIPVKPVSPKFRYKRSNSADRFESKMKLKDLPTNAKKMDKCEKMVQCHKPVTPKPFSFEKRDEELKRKREERIQKQLEKEKRLASQFKAQPLPAAVKKRMKCSSSPYSASSASSENKENHVKFEAKPPTVLYKEPFKPVLQQTHLVKSIPFELFTEKRAVERGRFEKHLREKEEEYERFKQQEIREWLEEEKREIAELRAKQVHHAKPVPSLDPFVPKKSTAPITVPETPKFVRRLKRH